MNQTRKLNLQMLAGTIGVCVFFAGIGYLVGANVATDDIIIAAPEPVIEELEQPIVIEVDGIGCVIAEAPVLTYYVSTDTVRVNIECDGELLNHYLPAVEQIPIVDKPSTK